LTEFLFELGSICAVIFGAEIADKTMLVTLALSVRYNIRQVLLGIIPACITVPIIGILIALVARVWLPDFWIQIISATLFVALFVWSIIEARDVEDAGDEKHWWDHFGPVAICFWAFFWAEMADRTQFATITVTTSGSDIIAAWLGSASGLMLANFVALALARLLRWVIPRQELLYGAGVLFLASGVWMYFSAFGVEGAIKWATAVTIGVVGLIPLMPFAAWRFASEPD